MNFIICPDSFKESLSASEAAFYIESGLKRSFPNDTYDIIPMSDGGEGFCEVMVNSLKGNFEYVKVLGPLCEEVVAKYAYIPDENKAIIEIAEACGLNLIPKSKRNPMITTTYGVGQLILHCLNKGITNILIGLGGSSTNDCGIGMLMALGAKPLNSEGLEVKLCENILSHVADIDISSFDKRLKEISIEVACDVNNPLLGINGATYTFAPQKGADENMLIKLEESMTSYSKILEKTFKKDISYTPKAGAAGGLGAAFLSLGYDLISGIDLVLKHSHFEKRIESADFIFTGEGSIDSQSKYGKVISKIAAVSKKYDIPVIAFCGKNSEDLEDLYDIGITSIFSITDSPKTLDEALKDGKMSLEKASFNVGRLIKSIYF